MDIEREDKVVFVDWKHDNFSVKLELPGLGP